MPDDARTRNVHLAQLTPRENTDAALPGVTYAHSSAGSHGSGRTDEPPVERDLAGRRAGEARGPRERARVFGHAVVHARVRAREQDLAALQQAPRHRVAAQLPSRAPWEGSGR